MPKITADMSMSLDGFIAGPNDSAEQGLGEGGQGLHQWLYDLSSFHERHGQAGGVQNQDAEILDEAFRSVGACLMGRRMFDFAEQAWGANPPFHVPVFVLTHRAQEKLVKDGGTTFTFVSDGIDSALAQARTAAGEQDIALAGGADIIQQYLKAGLVDEIQVHVIPLLLGAGTRLFDHIGAGPRALEPLRVIASPGVTHLKYRVSNQILDK
jgi:dihydrofolate reductase